MSNSFTNNSNRPTAQISALLPRFKLQEEPRYYDPTTLETPPGPSELPSSSGRLLCSFGLDGSKRGAMDYVAEDVLVFPAANTVQTLNVRTMVQAQMQVRGMSTVKSTE